MTDMIQKSYDVVVVGGGMSGLCAAIASARGGARTALVHNRPVLGGNANSEIRMHICSADNHGHRPNARETGITVMKTQLQVIIDGKISVDTALTAIDTEMQKNLTK